MLQAKRETKSEYTGFWRKGREADHGGKLSLSNKNTADTVNTFAGCPLNEVQRQRLLGGEL
jgi:hypothetical protein